MATEQKKSKKKSSGISLKEDLSSDKHSTPVKTCCTLPLNCMEPEYFRVKKNDLQQLVQGPEVSCEVSSGQDLSGAGHLPGFFL
jgi:hypothetical protein